jgi:hypothetical protein
MTLVLHIPCQGKDVSLLYWMLRRLATDPDTGVLLHLYECVALSFEFEPEAPDREKYLGAWTRGAGGRGGCVGVMTGVGAWCTPQR